MSKWNPFRRRQTKTADLIIWRFVVRAFALGVAGSIALHADVPVLIGLWTALILALAQFYGVGLKREDAAKIAVAAMASFGTFVGGVLAANIYFKLTIVGIPMALTLNALADGLLTCVVGVIVSLVFSSGGNDPKGGPAEGGDIVSRVLEAFAKFTGIFGAAFAKEWMRRGGSASALSQMLDERGFLPPGPRPA